MLTRLTPPRSLPWLTILLASVALLAFVIPTLSQALIYDRTALRDGQLWRLWTGHVTHVNGPHLGWNLAVFIPAGIWLERLRPKLTACFYFLGAAAISGVIYFWDPTLDTYSGLSGIATGQLVLLALLQLRRRKEEPAWFWWAVLALVAVKIGVELFTSSAVFVDYEKGIRNVPLAHIGGLLCAVVAGVLAPRKT